MIVVCGGTGRLGAKVANRLAGRGLPVRVLSRGLSAPAEALDGRVEVVHGDVRDVGSLDAAFAGAEVVVSAMHGFVGPGGVTPESVDGRGNLNLVAAAGRAGSDVVLVSVAGANGDSPLELARRKYGAEQALRASGCAWTVVRPDAFAQTWLEVLEETAGTSRRPLVFGDGDNPIAWVDVDDVAALVTQAVVDPTLRGRTLEICGPERLTLEELARVVMARNGWTGRPRHVPRVALHVMSALAGPVRPELARQARASLAMDRLPPTDDGETRAALPWLPATPVTAVSRERPDGGAAVSG